MHTEIVSSAKSSVSEEVALEGGNTGSSAWLWLKLSPRDLREGLGWVHVGIAQSPCSSSPGASVEGWLGRIERGTRGCGLWLRT